MPYIHESLRTTTPPSDKDKALGWLAWRFASTLPSTGSYNDLCQALYRFRRNVQLSVRGSTIGAFTEDIKHLRTEHGIDLPLIGIVQEMVEQEWYRRVVVPYEDVKRDMNGDVWVVE